MPSIIKNFTQIEKINFLLTNRIPRIYFTRFVGWLSRRENPIICKFSIAIWKLFADDLNLEEAKQTTFKSMQDCFTRELKHDARHIDYSPKTLVSPCDAIIGAFGDIDDTTVFQAKGYPYDLTELIADASVMEPLKHGKFITLRLQASMYHRFHAPADCSVNEINYISGDTWNVNPIALKRVEQLFCKNERAIIKLNTANPDQHIVLVPVAAILVASMRFNCLDVPLNLKYKGPNRLYCSAQYNKGDELGYFEQGSTIILLTSSNFDFIDTLKTGDRVYMGQPLLTSPQPLTGDKNDIYTRSQTATLG